MASYDWNTYDPNEEESRSNVKPPNWKPTTPPTLGGATSGVMYTPPGGFNPQGGLFGTTGQGGSKPIKPGENAAWSSMLGSTTAHVAPQRPTMTPQSGVTMSGAGGMSPGLPQFGQGNNLIGSQIGPNASGRLTGMRSLADSAAQRVAGAGGVQNINALRSGMQSGLTSAQQAQAFQYKPLNQSQIASSVGPMPTPSGEATGLRKMVMDDLGKVREGTDRASLMQQMYDQIVQRSQPQFDQSVRSLGQKTAALGRAGSGLYNSELSDLATSRERDLDMSRRELATRGASESLGDRLNILNATQGISSDISGQDAARYASYMGAQGDAYDRARDERDFEFNAQRYNNDLAFRRGGFEQDTAQGIYGAEGQYDDRNFGRSRAQLSDLDQYSGGIEDSERRDRGELRGERDYQYGLERDALGDAQDERLMQEDLLDRRFRRGTTLTGMGYDNSPQGAYSGASDYYSNTAGRERDEANDAYGAVGDLAQSYAQRRAQEMARLRPPNVPTMVDVRDEDIARQYGY